MQVVEKFTSINGEGLRAGELAVFIRFRGCNLQCRYCDTRWANEADVLYEDCTPEELLLFIQSTGIHNVTLTGGEPLLQNLAEFQRLLKMLHDCGTLRVEIETNGSIDLEPFCGDDRPVFTMDWKLPSSGCEQKMLPGNLKLLSLEDTVKFVAGSEEDLYRAAEIAEYYHLAGRCHIFFSPVFGKMEPNRIVEFMMKHKMNNTRLQLQMHKYIWDPDRRGV